MPNSKQPRILVADDDPAHLSLLTELLVMNSFDAVPVADGMEAVEKLAQNGIDLAILDVGMPGKDGFTITRELRADEKTRLLPIILVTGLNATEDRIRGIEAGCDDFISKPFHTGELLARIQFLLKLNYYRSLLDEKEKLEYVLENIDYGVVVLNRNLQPVRINKKAQLWLSLEGMDFSHDFFLRIQNRFHITYAGNMVKDIQELPLTFDIIRPESESHRPLILSVQSSVVRDAAQDVSSIMLLMTDVTDLRKEEYQKEVFMNIVSHKLRTPLAVMQGTLSLLDDKVLGPLTEKQEKAIRTVQKQVTGYTEAVQGVLGSTSVFSEPLKPKKEKVWMKEFLEGHVESFIKNVRDKKVTHHLKCIPENLSLALDREQFGLVIHHILDNAVKHGTENTVQIEIGAKTEGNSVEIVFYDNGPGIPPEERTKVFNRFYQAGKWDTGNTRGLGLGLAIVKHIVEAHDGSVEIKSSGEKGVACVLRLPTDNESLNRTPIHFDSNYTVKKDKLGGKEFDIV